MNTRKLMRETIAIKVKKTDVPFIQIFPVKFSEIQMSWLRIQIYFAWNLIEISV